MKSFLLLRDNHQSGPYTIEEMKKKGLYPSDLIWIEGESTMWHFPAELDELKAFIRQPERKKPVSKPGKEQSRQPVSVNSSKPVLESAAPVTDYSPYLHKVYEEEAKELFSDYRLQSSVRGRFSFAGNLVALLVLVIGVAMTAYVVRSIVLNFGSEGDLQSAQAMQIQSISYDAEHAAYAQQPTVQPAVMRESIPVLPETQGEEISAPEITPVTEIEKNVVKQEKTVAEKEMVPEPKGVKEEPVKVAAIESETEKQEAEPVKKEVSKKEVRSQVKVAANDYKKGILGGISDLEIQVTNHSGSTIDRATVEVNYYKPNGSVVSKEILQVQHIKPGGSKKVPVPPSSRGVKVDYKVVDVDVSDSTSR